MILPVMSPPVIQLASKGTDAPWQRDLAAFDAELAKRETAFAAERVPGDTKEGAKRILSHLWDMDQFSRTIWSLPREHGYGGTDAEKAFFAAYLPRQRRVDDEILRVFKPLLDRWGWFTISVWGSAADRQAWTLVQHADGDLPFQKRVLTILEPLVASGDTDPTDFAYLCDRVAVNGRRLQRFGTQGFCTGPSTWKPRPVEDPDRVDARRKAMGLPPLADYIAGMNGLCHRDETVGALKTTPLPKP